MKHEIKKREVNTVVQMILATKEHAGLVSRKSIAEMLGVDDEDKKESKRLDARISAARVLLHGLGYVVYNEPDRGYRLAFKEEQIKIEIAKSAVRLCAHANALYKKIQKLDDIQDGFEDLEDFLAHYAEDLNEMKQAVVDEVKTFGGNTEIKPTPTLEDEGVAYELESQGVECEEHH